MLASFFAACNVLFGFCKKLIIHLFRFISIFYFTKCGSINQTNNKTLQNRTEKNNKTRENRIDMQRTSNTNSIWQTTH